MRILKLVIWDLDGTLLTGVLEEGDDKMNPAASSVMAELRARGVLQALATQNQPQVLQHAADKFRWEDLFVQSEVDLGPKAGKVKRILGGLGINSLDAVFVDEDPFERDSIAVQVPGISAWSIEDLTSYVNNNPVSVTEEGRRRPEMYRTEQVRTRDEETAEDYLDFLRSCSIRVKVRPYEYEDEQRVEELLTRTHQMNLGVLPLDEAISRLGKPGENHVVVAEMRDRYGDMGRCGVIHLRPDGDHGAIIDSLAISCRTRARGLSLAMLVGLLRQRQGEFGRFRCPYIFNGQNRPLRMLLLATGFKPQRGTNDLILSADRLRRVVLPDWVNLSYDSR